MYISIAEAHSRLSSWLARIKDGPITITRRGKAVGVIVSPEEYDRLSQVRAYLEMLRLSQTLRERGLTADDLYKAARAELEERR